MSPPKSCKSWNLEFGPFSASRSHRVLLFSFYFMIYIFYFSRRVYIFFISVLAHGGVYLLSLGDRGSTRSKVSTFRNMLYHSHKKRKDGMSFRFLWLWLYLQMLLDDTRLLVPSSRDLRILSCMFKTVYIKFLHIAFSLYFLYSYGFP